MLNRITSAGYWLIALQMPIALPSASIAANRMLAAVIYSRDIFNTSIGFPVSSIRGCSQLALPGTKSFKASL